MGEKRKILQLLETYERASRQKVNEEKTSMMFSRNVNVETQQVIMAFWDVHICQQYDQYLGLPPLIGKEKPWPFFEIKYKMW